MTCCQTGEAKTHWVFFSHWHFFLGVWGTNAKVQKVSNFFWGENPGDFIHWDSAFPNSRQAPTHNQTCSRLPIDPVSSILDPRPVPLIILLFYACLTFHREIGGQTIGTIKTLWTPAIHQTDTAFPSHPVSGAGPPLLAVPPYMSKCLYVWMFICSHVLRGLQILDIRHWMANTKIICH